LQLITKQSSASLFDTRMAATLLQLSLVLAWSTTSFCQDLLLSSNSDATTSASPTLPGGTCQLSNTCIQGLNAPRACNPTTRNGGRTCYKGLRLWQQDLTTTYGCPLMSDPNQPVLSSRAFCWCGLNSDTTPVLNVTEQMVAAPDNGTASSRSQDRSDHASSATSSMRGAAALRAQRRHHSQGETDDGALARLDGVLVGKKKHDGCHGPCCRKHNGEREEHYGKAGMSNFMKQCAEEESNLPNPPAMGSASAFQDYANCMNAKSSVGDGCQDCYAHSLQCSEQYCLAECACVSYQDPTCNNCMTQHCRSDFDHAKCAYEPY